MKHLKYIALLMIVLLSCNKDQVIVEPINSSEYSYNLNGDVIVNNQVYTVQPIYFSIDSNSKFYFALEYYISNILRLDIIGSGLFINDTTLFDTIRSSPSIIINSSFDDAIYSVYYTYGNPKSRVFIEELDSNSYKLEINAMLVCADGFPQCSIVDEPPMDTIKLEGNFILSRIKN